MIFQETNEKKLESVAKIGDTAFSLDLKSNVLKTAKFLYSNYNNQFSIDYLNIYLIELATFYELFFKYKLSLINKSLIWKKPQDFNINKHKEGDFPSIDVSLAMSYAKNFGWINQDEYNLIDGSRKIRNKLIHFSACEQDEEENSGWRFELLEEKDMIQHLKLIKRLLKESKDSFEAPIYAHLIEQQKIYMEL